MYDLNIYTEILFYKAQCLKCFAWDSFHTVIYVVLLNTDAGEDPEYLIAGTHAYPSGPGKYTSNLTNLHACSSIIPVFISVFFLL